MKRTNKLIFAALCMTLVLASFLLVVAACNNQGYTVTTQYNSEQGTVTVSSPANGELFADGEQVTVTVTPKSNFEVKEFRVSGHSDAVLDADGKYTFAINGDTTITVTFADTRANITVNAGEGAHVTLNPQPQNGKLPKNTSVTVTVTVDAGYVLDAVIIGEEVQLVNNSYTFTVTDDVTIEVTTSMSPLVKALRALQGSVKFEGAMCLNYDGEQFNSTLITIFDVASDAVWQRDLSERYSTDMLWGRCADGSLGYYIHDFTNGHVKLVPYKDSSGEAVSFAQLQNVFDILVPSDFEVVEENVWSLVDKYMAQAVAFSITGYEFDVESLLITLTEDGVQLSIVSQDMEIEGEYGDSVTLSFACELTATKDGTIIPAEMFEDYAENSALAQALAAAAKATSYTASYSNKDLLEDSVSSYNVYVSDGRMWIDNPNDSFGYITRPDGKIWEFFVDEDFMWLGDDPVAKSLLEVSSNFDLGGISPSMFVLNDNGQYVLRDTDRFFYINSGLGLASIAAQALANGEQQYWDATEALTFAITLKDGKLYSVEYYCEYSQDGIVFRSHIDTVVFSDFNATELPGNVYIDEDLVQGIINPEYVGRWVTDDETLEIEFTLDGIKVDGFNRAYDIVAIAGGGYRFSCYMGEYTAVIQGDKLHVTDPDGEEFDMRLKLSDWDNLLGTFSLKVYLGDRNYLIISVEIGIEDVVVLLGDVEMTSWNCYINSDGVLAVWTDYLDFYIWQADVDGNAIFISFFDDDGEEIGFTLYREGVEADVSDYEGTFFATSIDDFFTKVKIEDNSISVWLDGINGEIVATDIRVNTYLQSNGESFVEICFNVEGFVCYLQILSNDKILVYDLLDIWGECVLVREGYVVDYSQFYGDYKALDNADNTIHIENGKITLVIDGVTYEFTNIIYYDVEYRQPRFGLYNDDGDLFVLRQYGYIPGYFIYHDEWGNNEITFVKDGFVPDTSYIDGTYYGYDEDDSEYIVVIANGTITVSIDGDEQTITQVMYNEYDDYLNGGTFYMLSFMMNGVNYCVQPAWEMYDRAVQLYYAEVGADYALFTLNLDQEEELYDWSDFEGVYEGDGYRVVITVDAVTVNGTVLNADKLHFFSNFDYNSWSTYYEFRFDYNGASYVMQPADDGNCMIMVPASGGAIYVLVIEDYELDEYYGYMYGYYESDYTEHDHFYVIDIDDDYIDIYIDGELCDTTVLYYGPDGGFVVDIDGKIYHIMYDHELLILFDNDQVLVVLTFMSRPRDDWSDYYGTWEGVDGDTTYSIEIGDGIFTVTIDGEEVDVYNVTMRYDRDIDWDVFTFVMNGKRFTMVMYWDYTAYLHDDDNDIAVEMAMVGGVRWKGYLGYWECEEDGVTYGLRFTETDVIFTIDGEVQDIEFAYDSDSDDFEITYNNELYYARRGGNEINMWLAEDWELFDIYLQYMSEGCEWEETLGTYTNENGSVTIKEDSIVIRIGSVYYTAYAEDDLFRHENKKESGESYHEFFFTTGSVDYWIKVYPESGTLIIEDDGDLYEIMEKSDEPGDCEWSDFFGTWYAEDWCEYTFVISANGIHAIYDIYDYNISAANLTFIAGDGFYWTYDGVEYMLQISDDELYFTDVDEEGEYYAYLEKIETGDDPVDCAWEEMIGTWYAQDEYEYTFIITADGIRAIYDTHDYTIYADFITFIEGEGLYWTYNDVEYKIVLDDDSWYFADAEESSDYWTYLEKIA